MPTITRVLCPVDFSELSAHAVRYADALAAWHSAGLTLQYVYLPLFIQAPGLPQVTESLPASEMERLVADARAFAAKAGCDRPDLAVAVDTGRAADEILARAALDHADLIVMGTHGLSGVRHLMLGSVTERVLRQAVCPVLTVPPQVNPAGAVAPFTRIIAAVDFSDWSIGALRWSAALADRTGATLTAVHTVEWPWPEPPAPAFEELPPTQAAALQEYRRYVIDRAHARLASTVAEVVPPRCAVDLRIVHGKPYAELVRLAAEQHADLIALGVHGRSAVDMALFGSTTNQVVRHAACPVLTVRR